MIRPKHSSWSIKSFHINGEMKISKELFSQHYKKVHWKVYFEQRRSHKSADNERGANSSTRSYKHSNQRKLGVAIGQWEIHLLLPWIRIETDKEVLFALTTNAECICLRSQHTWVCHIRHQTFHSFRAPSWEEQAIAVLAVEARKHWASGFLDSIA